MKKNIFGESFREKKRLDRNREKNRKYQKNKEKKLYEKAVVTQERLREERKEYKRKQKVKRDTDRRRENHKLKTKLLEISGVDLFGLTYADIEKVSMAEVRAGKLKPDTIFKFKQWSFDWNKVYDLTPDSLYIAFIDYAEERRFQDILGEMATRTNSELLALLHYIVNLPVTYLKGKAGSSGRAGSGIFACGEGGRYGSLWDDYVKVRSYNNHINALHRKQSDKVRLKSGKYKGWQVLKNGSKSTFTKVTPRKVLEVITGLLWNVVEIERMDLYSNFMRMVRKHMPDIIPFLPDERGAW